MKEFVGSCNWKLKRQHWLQERFGIAKNSGSFHLFPLSLAVYSCKLAGNSLDYRLPHSSPASVRPYLCQGFLFICFGFLQKSWHFFWLLFVRSCNHSWFNHCGQEIWMYWLNLGQMLYPWSQTLSQLSWNCASPEGKGEQMLHVHYKVLVQLIYPLISALLFTRLDAKYCRVFVGRKVPSRDVG